MKKSARPFLACWPLLALACALLLQASCSTRPPAPAADAPRPPLLLISLDGFRWDYCAKYPAETPNLRRLIQTGVTARRLTPVFPSNTFPNHYSIVTGLYPAHHGMINNEMFDAATGEKFYYKSPQSVLNPRWWGGQPIWTTAVLQGRKSAAYFWPGSENENHGVRPTFAKTYDYSIPFAQRLDTLVGWLSLPAAERPAVVAFYFEESNSFGHNFGPDSPELAAAIKLLDARIGEILARFAAAHIAANLVIVSDHGMTNVSPDRVLILDDYVADDEVQVDFSGAATGLRPLKGDAAALVARFAQLPHAKAYLTADLPAHLHMSDSPRTPPVWLVADEGWLVVRRSAFEKWRGKFLKGEHGYDPAFTSMGATFIAQGPSFKSGVTLDAVENIHIYNLLCAALGLTPAPNDGDDRLVRAALRP